VAMIVITSDRIVAVGKVTGAAQRTLQAEGLCHPDLSTSHISRSGILGQSARPLLRKRK